jgi:hypothetical protein
MEPRASARKKAILYLRGKMCLLLWEEEMKTRKQIRLCSWANYTQLCFVSGLPCKHPKGLLGAAAGKACGVAGNLGMAWAGVQGTLRKSLK